MYETPGKQKDPFKTVSSGYPDNDQGMSILQQEGTRPEDLDRIARETGKDAKRIIEEATKEAREEENSG
jgi:hypothetical protein